MRFKTLFLIVLLAACNTIEKNAGLEKTTFSFPPEWEPHEAVWTDIASEWTVVPNQQAKLKIIAALSKHVKTKVVFDSDSLKEVALNGLSELSADLSKVSFIKTSAPMNWIRDPGPIFVTNGKELKVIDFEWSCYGRRNNISYLEASTTNLMDRRKSLGLMGAGAFVLANSSSPIQVLNFPI